VKVSLWSGDVAFAPQISALGQILWPKSHKSHVYTYARISGVGVQHRGFTDSGAIWSGPGPFDQTGAGLP